MVRAPLMKRLIFTTNRFGFEPEITARLAQAHARIWELPISYSGRTYEEGKKIGWKDGVAACWHIAKFNLLPPRNKTVRAKDRDQFKRVTPGERSETRDAATPDERSETRGPANLK
jgi:hypothetical protein